MPNHYGCHYCRSQGPCQEGKEGKVMFKRDSEQTCLLQIESIWVWELECTSTNISELFTKISVRYYVVYTAYRGPCYIHIYMWELTSIRVVNKHPYSCGWSAYVYLFLQPHVAPTPQVRDTCTTPVPVPTVVDISLVIVTCTSVFGLLFNILCVCIKHSYMYMLSAQVNIVRESGKSFTPTWVPF
jgi:hypothetical protein